MDNKNELIRSMMDVEYVPPSELVKINIDLEGAEQFSIEEAMALGVTFEPLKKFIEQSMAEGEKSDGKFNPASITDSLSQLSQMQLDPVMLTMAIALMAIDKKLDDIHETQKEILAYLELMEEAKLKGNLNALADVLNNYKFNWDNNKYKAHKHILVQDIKREAEQSIILYSEQLRKALDKKSILPGAQRFKATLNKTMNRLNSYQLALYTFSFSSFLEVMLLENFDSNYLNSITNKIKEYSGHYSELYENCSKKISEDYKSSLESFTLKNLSKISSGAGKALNKTPISKSQLDNILTVAGDKLKDANTSRTENITQILANNKTDYVSPFVENIQTLDQLFNKPRKVMFDSENIYIV